MPRDPYCCHPADGHADDCDNPTDLPGENVHADGADGDEEEDA